MFAFSKKTNTVESVAAFNTVFGAMLADGRYKEIAQRYLPCTVSVESLGCK
jgi:ABC-type amino acid transport substrate-binding protein